jgi:hypothetical protein
MSENKHSHHQHGGQDHNSVHHAQRPYWTRAHHDWKFWVALFLMLAAMIIYVMSDDLALRPHRQAQQPLSGAVSK